MSIDVSSTEARTGLMCMQCSSVMNRNAVPAADLEWEHVADSYEDENPDGLY